MAGNGNQTQIVDFIVNNHYYSHGEDKVINSIHKIKDAWTDQERAATKYLKNEEEMMASLKSSLDDFSKKQKSTNLAKEVTNNVNALKATLKGGYDSVFNGLDKTMQDLISKADKMSSKVKGVIPVESFIKMKDALADVGDVKLGAEGSLKTVKQYLDDIGNAKGAQEQKKRIEEFNRVVAETAGTAREAGKEVASIGSGNSAANLQKEAERFKDIAKSLLSDNGISGNRKATSAITKLAKDITLDVETVDSALEKFKAKMNEFTSEANNSTSNLSQSGLTNLEDFFSRLKEVLSDGVNINIKDGGLSQLFETIKSLSGQSFQAPEGLETFFNSVDSIVKKADRSSIDSLGYFLQQISQLKDKSSNIGSLTTGLQNLGDAQINTINLNALLKLDWEKLASIKTPTSTAIKNLTGLSEGLAKLSTVKADTINKFTDDKAFKFDQMKFPKDLSDQFVKLATALTKFNKDSAKNINAVLNLPFDKLNNFTPQSDKLDTLSTALSTLSKVNTQGISDLVNSNLEEFVNSLNSIDAGALDNLAKMADGLGAVKMTDSLEKMYGKLDEIFSKIGSKTRSSGADKEMEGIGSKADEARKKIANLDKSMVDVMDKLKGSGQAGITDTLGNSIGDIAKEIKALAKEANNLDTTEGVKAWEERFKKVSASVTELQDQITRLKSAGTFDQSYIKIDDKEAAKIIDLRTKLESLRQKAIELGDTNLAEQIGQSIQELVSFDSELAKGKTRSTEYAATMDKITGAYKRFNAEVKQSAAGIKAPTIGQDQTQLANYLSQINNMQASVKTKLTNWSAAANSSVSGDYNALKEVYKELDILMNDIDKMDKGSADNLLANLKSRVDAASNSIIKADKATMSLSGRISQAAKNYLTYFTGMSAIMKVVQYGKQAVQSITEIDTAMSQLRIVTQETDKAISNYSDNIVNIANKTAGSVKELVDATTTYARLGFSLDESSSLAEYTQMLTNVAGVDSSAAQDAITAIVKAYGLGADDLEAVMDRMVAVGKQHCPTTQQCVA